MSIGQGAVSVTPVSMAVYMATLANGGTRVTPHLLKAVDDGTGWKPVPPPPPQSQVAARSRQAAGDSRRPVDGGERRGTGGRARIAGYDVSGKTGTAQVISNQGKERAGKTDKDLRDNGWFVFFAPRDNPQIAGVVFARARRARLQRRADRAPRAGHVLREEGRAAAAAAAGRSSRRPPVPLSATLSRAA